MVISFRKKFLFVHIRKTAGSSIQTALRPHRDVYSYREKIIDEVAKALGLRIRRYEALKRFAIHRHATLRELREGFGPDIVDSLFKFAFVRNPYDLLVSEYFYELQDEKSPFHEVAKYVGDFDGYVRWRTTMCRVTQFERIKGPDAKVGLDFVGRFEQLSGDFAQICNRIGISAPLLHENRSLKRPSREYVSFYGARETRDRVLQTFAIDFDTFGYSTSLEEAQANEMASIASGQ